MYSIEEMVVLSMLYAKTKRDRFTMPVFNHLLLSEVFKVSLDKHMTLFDRNNIVELVELAQERCEIRYPDKNFDKDAKDIRGFFSAFNYRKAIREAENEMRVAGRKNIKIITYLDEEYPEHLRNIEIPPFVLYIKGKLPSEETLSRSLSIVGARNFEKNYGSEIAGILGETLLDKGWYNVGGLTAGCGEYGHRGSLGATGAVLGQGLATTIFPLENKKLAEEMLENDGFILSELPPRVKPNPVGIVARDRIQSGLTRGIVVVETSESSGIMHTVKYALNQGRKVFVVDVAGFADEVENENNVSGNIALLDTQRDLSTNVKISAGEKERIIGISEKDEFISFLEKLEEGKLSESEHTGYNDNIIRAECIV